MNTTKQTTRLWADLVREQAVPLLTLFAIAMAINLTLEDLLQNLTRTEEDQRWIIQLGLALVDFVEGVVQILMLSWGIPKVRALTEAHFQKKPFETSYLNSFLAEYLRSLASMILWMLMLIVPGIYRYMRLIFVPFVTLFAKPYRDDQVDAFELSIALTQGRMRTIFAIVAGSFALQILFQFLPQSEMFHTWPIRVACGAASFLASAWIFARTYVLFERAMEEHQWT